MTISSKSVLCHVNQKKSQGQSVDYVGWDLRNAVFTHGQLYVAISVYNIKAIWDSRLDSPVTKSIVYSKVGIVTGLRNPWVNATGWAGVGVTTLFLLLL